MSNANPYNLTEGETVEEQSVYEPERLVANGAIKNVEFGDPEQIWSDYALEILPLYVDGEDTGRRFIMRNGNVLGDVSDRYRLVPNEEVVAAADDIAQQMGAEPFHEFGGDWYVKLQNNVFMDDEGRRAHALYAWDDPVEIGHGDEVQLGFGVHNSIDGSMGLRVGLFTFRHACANMVFMGLNRDGMSFDSRDVLKHSSKKHTHGLEISELKAWIEDTVGYGQYVIDAYRRWNDRELQTEEALELIDMVRNRRLSVNNDVPEWIQDAVEYVEDLEEKLAEGQKDVNGNDAVGENGLTHEHVAGIAEAHIPQATTAWDTYNDLTESIWHNDSTNDQSKLNKMRQTHKVFDPSPVADDIEVSIR